LVCFLPPVAAIVAKEFRDPTRTGFAYLSLRTPPLLIRVFQHEILPEASDCGLQGRLRKEIFAFFSRRWPTSSDSYGARLQQAVPMSRGIQTYFTAPRRSAMDMLAESVLVYVLAWNRLSLAMLVARRSLPSAPGRVATGAAMRFHHRGSLTIANWAAITVPRTRECGHMPASGKFRHGRAGCV